MTPTQNGLKIAEDILENTRNKEQKNECVTHSLLTYRGHQMSPHLHGVLHAADAATDELARSVQRDATAAAPLTCFASDN